MIIKCAQCGLEINSKKPKQKFCSMSCVHLSQTGVERKWTDEWKKKIVESAKKRIGTHVSEETKRKIGIAHSVKQPWVSVRNRQHTGELHPNWKGGISYEGARLRQKKENKDWRNDILTRDGYVCKKCGYTGKDVVVDHIKPFSLFPELRQELTNGQVLCKKCHNSKNIIDWKLIRIARDLYNQS